eukprot:gene6239-1114_t
MLSRIGSSPASGASNFASVPASAMRGRQGSQGCWLLRTEDTRSTAAVAVPGLCLHPCAIPEETGAALVTFLDRRPWSTHASDDKALHRRVQHYCHRFNYATKAVDPVPLGPLPEPLIELSQQLIAQGMMHAEPDQVTINEYNVGQGIGSHVDTHSSFGPEICILSLGSGVTMQFRQLDGQSKAVYLPPLSLL